MPRTSVGVRREGRANIGISFNEDGCGHMEIVSLAEAEALAERILDWVEFIRFEQFTGPQE